jgi:hypothetical protein
MEKELEPEKLAKIKQILETDKVSSPPPPKNIGPKSLRLLNSPYLRISLTLILFLLIFTITFTTAYLSIRKKQQTSAQNIVPESEIVLPTVTQDSETANQVPNGSLANWKIYTNKEHGFSMQYPAKLQNLTSEGSEEWSLHISDQDKEDLYGTTLTAGLLVSIHPNPKTKEGKVISTVEESYYGEKTYTVGEFQGYSALIRETEVDSSRQKVIHFLKDNVLWRIIGGTYTKNAIVDYDDILYAISTFKLTNQDVQGVTTSSDFCLKSERIMLEEISECEVINEKVCLELKKEFDACMDVCQKELEEKICFDVCKPVCE